MVTVAPAGRVSTLTCSGLAESSVHATLASSADTDAVTFVMYAGSAGSSISMPFAMPGPWFRTRIVKASGVVWFAGADAGETVFATDSVAIGWNGQLR